MTRALRMGKPPSPGIRYKRGKAKNGPVTVYAPEGTDASLVPVMKVNRAGRLAPIRKRGQS